MEKGRSLCVSLVFKRKWGPIFCCLSEVPGPWHLSFIKKSVHRLIFPMGNGPSGAPHGACWGDYHRRKRHGSRKNGRAGRGRGSGSPKSSRNRRDGQENVGRIIIATVKTWIESFRQGLVKFRKAGPCILSRSSPPFFSGDPSFFIILDARSRLRA